MKVFEETCGCGARLELSDYLASAARAEYIEGFRKQHAAHDTALAALEKERIERHGYQNAAEVYAARESRYTALEKAARAMLEHDGHLSKTVHDNLRRTLKEGDGS